MTAAVRLSDMIRARSSPELVLAIREAAKRARCDPAELVRRFATEGIQRFGIDPALFAGADAGTLYTVTPEGRQWALLREDGSFDLVGGRSHEPPRPDDRGERWVAVEYRDSGSFDPAKHYRHGPATFVEGDKVVREYMILPREAE